MISVTDKQNHTERKAPRPDLIPASLGDLPSTRLRQGEKTLPPDWTTRICMSSATPDPCGPQQCSTDTFRSANHFYVTRKSWVQSNPFEKHTGRFVSWEAYILLLNQPIGQFQISLIQSPTHFDTPVIAFPTGLLLPLLLQNMGWATHLTNLDLWKGRCFSVLVTITLCFKLQLIFPCLELQLAKVP